MVPLSATGFGKRRAIFEPEAVGQLVVWPALGRESVSLGDIRPDTMTDLARPLDEMTFESSRSRLGGVVGAVRNEIGIPIPDWPASDLVLEMQGLIAIAVATGPNAVLRT